MQLPKDLNELIQAGVISQETADQIQKYYLNKSGPPLNKLVIIFGILGSLLIGMGFILILAHNWDDLSRAIKTIIAFIPLLAGQAICGYTLMRKADSMAWKEAGSTFLVLSIGTCIALISQVYHISGSLSSFLWTWIILSLPVVYVMRSSMASLLYIIGITAYACEVGYWGSNRAEEYTYWPLLILALPHYYLLYKKHSTSNFFTFHNWFIPLSVITALGTVATSAEELMFIAYISLFGLLYLIGQTPVLRELKVRNNGYLVLGSLGTVALLLGLSFDWFWESLRNKDFTEMSWSSTPEFAATVLITLTAMVLLFFQKKNEKPFQIKPVEFIFILFILIFLIGLQSSFSTLFINIVILGIGVMTIREGARRDHFGILNYGLMIVSALVICRFFDTNLSFVIRGLLFIGVGIGFFLGNYWMINRKRKIKSMPVEINRHE